VFLGAKAHVHPHLQALQHAGFAHLKDVVMGGMSSAAISPWRSVILPALGSRRRTSPSAHGGSVPASAGLT
jgi:hypothetical protein